MKTRVNAYSYLLVALLGLGGSSAWGQVDPTKALVGTWVGHVELPRDAKRVLVITSVTPKEGGGWLADGRLGFTVEKAARREIEVSLQGSDIILEFAAGLNNPVRLKLVGENRLEGTLNIVAGQPGQGPKAADRSFKLEKVEPKAGDVK